MLSQTGTLWHYLGSFVAYTLLAVGLIYAAYWYSRKVTGGFLGLKKPEETENKLEVESTLALEPHKNLYVVRAGQERFLIAASGDNTQLLSRLETQEIAEPIVTEAAPAVDLPIMERPWYADPPARIKQKPSQAGFGSRFMQSVRWLVSSRSKLR